MELRRSVHEAAPHLTENLRRALSERRKAESVPRGNPPAIALEYPLGPRVTPPQPLSTFTLESGENCLAPSMGDLGPAIDFFSSNVNVAFDNPPPSGSNGLFDGTTLGSLATVGRSIGPSIRFEVPSSTSLGEDGPVFSYDGPSDPKPVSGGQGFGQGGHLPPPF